MYVCICMAVTDGDIRRAAARGCCQVRDLGEQLGVGTQCGKCASHARAVLREVQAQQASFDLASALPAC